jgi:hypothetical protein
MKRRTVWALLASAAAASAVLSSARLAHAQTSGDPVLARQLFKEGRALAADGHYDRACPKFEESLKQEEGVGTLFNLADCWEKIGRTASAWTRFLDAATIARHAGQTDREKVARDRASQLEPRLSRLTIDVQSTAPGLVVTKNGAAPIEKAAWGSAVPVDPGSYSIEANAPGRKPWKGSVTVASGGASVRLTVPELAVESAAALSPVPTPATTESAFGGEAQVSESSGRGSTQRTAALVVGGVGLVAVAGGIVFGLRAKSKADGLAGICPAGSGCTQGEVDAYASQRDESVTARTLSIVGFGIGGAALAAGAALYLTAPNGAPKSSQVGVWTDGHGLAGLRLEGAW